MNILRVIIHNKIEILDEIIPSWKQLKSDFLEITVFQKCDWLKYWLKYKRKDKQRVPYIIELRDKNETVGIIPLYLYKREFLNIKFRILKPIGIENSNNLLPILSKNYSSDYLLGKAIKAIYKDKKNWDCIDWWDIPDDSGFASFLKKQTHLIKRKKINLKKSSISPMLILDKDMDCIEKRASKKFIKGIHRYKRKLKREGVVQYNRVTKEEEIEPIMKMFFDFHCERWSLTDTPSMFRLEEERNWMMCTVKSLFNANLLHLSYLTHNGEIAAIELGVSEDKIRYLLMGTMNPNFLKYRIGHIMLYYVIKEACAEGYETIDFLEGQEDYKQKWGPVNKVNLYYIFFNNSIKSNLLRLIKNTYLSNRFQHDSLFKKIPLKVVIRIGIFFLNISDLFKRSFTTKMI